MGAMIGRPLQAMARWLGGWPRLVLLILAVVGVAYGLLREQNRRPPVPPQATQIQSQLSGDMRQTSFRYGGSIDEVRGFYRGVFPERGWSYCGTQATEGCSNLLSIAGRSDDAIDVYRAADDTERRGPTIEIWPIADPNGQTFVTIFETRGR